LRRRAGKGLAVIEMVSKSHIGFKGKASGRTGKRSIHGYVSIYRRSDEHLNIHSNGCEIPPLRRGNAAIGLKMGFWNHF